MFAFFLLMGVVVLVLVGLFVAYLFSTDKGDPGR